MNPFVAHRARGFRFTAPLLLLLVSAGLLVPGSEATAEPLFTFAQISDSQPNAPADFARLEEVLDAIAASGQSGALIPQPVDFVIFPGDLVSDASSRAEWGAVTQALDSRLTANGIPYLAVPGNHDVDGFGIAHYEEFIGDSGVWDAEVGVLVGQNGLAVATGWSGIRFIGFNNSNGAWNAISPADLAEIEGRVADAAARGENVFLVGHHPHDGQGVMPLASVLEVPEVNGYMRGHSGSPQVDRLSGIWNPNVWDFNSQSIVEHGTILYFEVFASELHVHLIQLALSPGVLPAPIAIPLVHPLLPAPPPVVPTADFEATPVSGAAPLEVAFSDTSLGSPMAWLWDFGDGQTSNHPSPVHTYMDEGVYDVSLLVSNAAGSDQRVRSGLVNVLAAPPILAFQPSADARVRSTSPSSNYGYDDRLRVRSSVTLEGSDIHESYLTFDVVGIVGEPPASARLRLYVTDGSTDGGTLYETSDGWSEAGITWNTAPGPLGGPLASLGPVAADSWVEFDVTPRITADGVYSFVLTSSSSNSAYFSSREGLNPPQLLVETGPTAPTVAEFAGEPLSGTAPREVSFSDLSTGAPTSWFWEFGDGATSTQQDPVHVYANPGVYTVTLAASGPQGGDSRTKPGYVVVAAPVLPTADFSADPVAGTAPLVVSFSDLSQGEPTSWLWDFGDGLTSTERSPVHTYAAAGVYDVSLTVGNGAGSDTSVRPGLVSVLPPPPTLVFPPVADALVKSSRPTQNYGADPVLRLRQGTTLYDSYLAFDVAGLGSAAVVSARLRLFVTDGSSDGGTVHATASDWSETGITWENAPGMLGPPLDSAGAVSAGEWVEFDVTPELRGDGAYAFGLTSASSNSVYFSSREGADPPELVVEIGDPVAPVADFAGAPQTGTAPLEVSFVDLSSASPTGWFWEFGDGAVSTLQDPVHVYAAPGIYTVTLTASNAEGSDAETRTGYVVVEAPVPPVADFSATPLSGEAPLLVSFSDLSQGTPTAWLWDFGDGATSTEQNPVHTYAAAGVYDVSLTATNVAGTDLAVRPGLVNVAPPLPRLTFTAVADAKVSSGSPDDNYGSSSDLRVRDGNTSWRSLLRFEVSGVDLPVVSATLRLFVIDGSHDGGTFFRVGDAWTEQGVTWNTAPLLDGAILGMLGPISTGTWVEIDVTPEVTGDGVYSIGILNGSGNSAYFSSREGPNPPELVIVTELGP